MPHCKGKWRIDELDEEWLAKQELPEKCRCGNRGIWILGVSSLSAYRKKGRKDRIVGPFCNKCVKREFESS